MNLGQLVSTCAATGELPARASSAMRPPEVIAQAALPPQLTRIEDRIVGWLRAQAAPASSRDIIDAMRLSKGTVNSALRALLAKQAVSRTRAGRSTADGPIFFYAAAN